MSRILEFIEKDGEGKYFCYKTRKLILDQNDQDTLDYDDKPALEQHSGTFAETDLTRIDTVRIDERMMKLANMMASNTIASACGFKSHFPHQIKNLS